MSAIPNDSPASVHVSPPSGTITFAFTEIEDSAPRWDRDPAAMQAAVRRHGSLMRGALLEHGGHIFKTVGDAFCVAFARPEAAVAALVTAQRALALEDFSAVGGLRVRGAIHTGTADERDADYFGPTLNRVARLLAIGHGGQVLVSGTTAGLMEDVVPSHVTLRDLGRHRLRDLTMPEHVYELALPERRADFPPLRSLDVLPNNLPRTPNSFIGRDTEVAEIAGLVARHELVTLVGAGGVGKTRAALQVAANLLDGWDDGVWFIEFAALASGDYLPSTIARALAVELPRDVDARACLARALASKRALLILDNCEHVIESAASTIGAILRGCPRVRILATSRQPLGIGGEATYRLPPLGVPSAANTASLTAAEAARYAAITLFRERARAADVRFELTDENAPTIADICRRVDGLPLAIELAASRVRILGPRQIREHLNERFRVLTGGSRAALPRQQTIRALIDWSHDLLDERERVFFRRLAIFVNGFTLESAIALGRPELDEFDAFDVLSSLADKSLVQAEPQGDTLRYRLLESTRAYAVEKLVAAGERNVLESRHLCLLRDRFTELQRYYESSARHTSLENGLATELEDVRVALDGALARSDLLPGAELLAAVGTAWKAIGYTDEGVAWIERYRRALPARSSLSLARLSTALSWMLAESGRLERSFEVSTEAVAHARSAGERIALAAALNKHAWSAMTLGKFDEAHTALAEAEAIPSASPAHRRNLLLSRSNLSQMRGDLDTAARLYDELRELYRAVGDERGQLIATGNLALVEHERGETSRAIALVREILPAIRAGRDTNLLLIALLKLAHMLVTVDELSEAADIAREVIRHQAAREPNHAFVALAIEYVALADALHGDLRRGAILEGYAAAALQRHGFKRDALAATMHHRLDTLLRVQLPADQRERGIRAGAVLAPPAAVELALGQTK